MLTCRTNRELLLPYALPYILWVLISTLLHGHLNWVYGLRIILVTFCLWFFRRCYGSLYSVVSLPVTIFSGLFWGVVGCFLWVVLLSPFAAKNVLPWEPMSFYLRVMSAALLVPVFEELLMRGYVFGLASQWEQFRKKKRKNALGLALDHSTIHDIGVPSWSVAGVLVSTLFFAMGHRMYEWPAAIAYGFMMSFLLVRTGGLLSCMIAHGTTNLTLGIYVWYTGRWGLW